MQSRCRVQRAICAPGAVPVGCLQAREKPRRYRRERWHSATLSRTTPWKVTTPSRPASAVIGYYEPENARRRPFRESTTARECFVGLREGTMVYKYSKFPCQWILPVSASERRDEDKSVTDSRSLSGVEPMVTEWTGEEPGPSSSPPGVLLTSCPRTKPTSRTLQYSIRGEHGRTMHC